MNIILHKNVGMAKYRLLRYVTKMRGEAINDYFIYDNCVPKYKIIELEHSFSPGDTVKVDQVIDFLNNNTDLLKFAFLKKAGKWIYTTNRKINIPHNLPKMPDGTCLPAPREIHPHELDKYKTLLGAEPYIYNAGLCKLTGRIYPKQMMNITPKGKFHKDFHPELVCLFCDESGILTKDKYFYLVGSPVAPSFEDINKYLDQGGKMEDVERKGYTLKAIDISLLREISKQAYTEGQKAIDDIKSRFIIRNNLVPIEAANQAVKCSNCGTLVLRKHYMEIKKHGLCYRRCIDCYTPAKCDVCKRHQPTISVGGGRVCFNCFAKADKCYNCNGRIINKKTARYNKKMGYICSRCVAMNQEKLDQFDPPVIDHYHAFKLFTPIRVRHEPIGEPLFGMEYETCIGEHDDLDWCAQELRNDFGHVVTIQEDTSIDYGFECIFNPMSLKYVKDKNIHNRLVQHEFLVPDPSCGIHIHIDQNAFTSKTHIYKFIKFFAKNHDFVEWLADRPPNQYWEHITPGSIKSILAGGGQRYSSINNNRKTLEVRCFASTTSATQIARNYEFLHALWDYTRQSVRMDAKSFIDTTKSKTIYPNLNQMLNHWYSINPKTDISCA